MLNKRVELNRQIIIYRELPVNRKLEVKVFNSYEDCNEFLRQFLDDKESYISETYLTFDPRSKKDIIKEEEEYMMTPWQNIDFVEFERVEIGGHKIGYRG